MSCPECSEPYASYKIQERKFFKPLTMHYGYVSMFGLTFFMIGFLLLEFVYPLDQYITPEGYWEYGPMSIWVMSILAITAGTILGVFLLAKGIYSYFTKAHKNVIKQ